MNELKGVLYYMGYNHIKLVTPDEVIDLQDKIEKFYAGIDDKLAIMDNTRDTFTVQVDETSTRRYDHKTMWLKNADLSFGFSNVEAYMEMTMQSLNARNVIIKLSDTGLSIEPDSENDNVYGLYYTRDNKCHIPNDKVKELCKTGTESTCIFLTATGNGFECVKFDSFTSRQLLHRLKMEQMNATRIGNCKLMGRKENADLANKYDIYRDKDPEPHSNS